MNEMQVFESAQFGRIRGVTMNGQPWLVGKDVAAALGYSNTKDAIGGHVDAEDRQVIQRSENATFEIPNRGLTVINESGLYSLILSSKLPSARAFKRWVTAEVLPSIRKNGGYIAGQETLTDAELLAKAVLVANRTIQERDAKIREMEAQAALNAPKVLFADAVSASNSTILVGELAKLLEQNGVENMGQNRLFAWMRQNGYLIQRKGTDYNMPTQRSMELGLFRVKETAVTHADGHVTVSKTAKVSAKGQQYFIRAFLFGKRRMRQ